MDEPTVENPVLELRIHGVNNTPPEGMLDLQADAVELVSGDTLASFWRPKPGSIEKLARQDRGYVRPGIMREAYSWGGMARNSVGGQSGLKKALAVGARVGWMLLLPFGLVNVAYWARRLDDGPPERAAHAEDTAGWRRGARGGATLRVVGLLMTLLLTTTAAIIPMDLVGIQCYASTDRACSNLPSQIGFLKNWNVGERLALLSLVPLLLIFGLWSLAAKTRTSYDRATWTATDTDLGGAAGARKQWPMLTTPGFWQHHVITSKTALLHLAAAMVLLELTTAWHGLFGAGGACTRPGDLVHLDRGCRDQVSHSGGHGIVELIMIGLGLAVLVLIVVRVLIDTEDAADVRRRGPDDLGRRRWGVIIAIIGAAVLFIGQEVILIWWHGTSLTAPRLVGISETPVIIICLLFGLSLSALFWRRATRWPALMAGLTVAVLLVLSGFHDELSWIARIAAVILVGGLVIGAMHPGRHREHEAWHGSGPGVVLLLALLIAMILSAALLVGVANLLNGTNSAASLAGAKLADAPKKCQYSCETSKGAAGLLLPQPFVWFGAALLAMLALLVLVLIVVAAGTARKARRDHTVIDPIPVPTAPEEPENFRTLAKSAREFAQVAHRGEAVLGLIAVLGAVCLCAALLMAVIWDSPRMPNSAAKIAIGALGPGMWASATIGGSLIALAAGGSALASKRPLGLLWDLICFLPRAGHPLGPPCYAERAVPELLARYEAWLGPQTDLARPPGQKIVLSAHSLGSVIAVASIFALQADEERKYQVAKLSLVTYGSQLRAYFGRIFPELLGPEVLGNHPVLPAGLIDPNPVVGHQERQAPEDARALTSLLDVHGPNTRWISLWRRTDYLGFPVYDGVPRPTGVDRQADDPNPVDRGAEEVDTTGYMLAVLSHSDYPRTPAYREALDDLMGGPE
jgi:hypothetical protein